MNSSLIDYSTKYGIEMRRRKPISLGTSVTWNFVRDPENKFRVRPGLRLFKYLPRQYAEMLLDGSVQLNTLANCTRIEASDLARSDPGEGQLLVVKQMPPFAWQRVEVADNTSAHTAQSVDLWLYCVTTRYEETVMRSFGCDSCVVISRPDEFADAISDSLGTDQIGRREGECVYQPRNFVGDMPLSTMPWLVKSPQYQEQREFRFLWQPPFDGYPISVRQVRIATTAGMLDLYRG